MGKRITDEQARNMDKKDWGLCIDCGHPIKMDCSVDVHCNICGSSHKGFKRY